MQHLRVREHDVRVLAGPGPVVGRSVAVVGHRAQAGDEPRAQRPELVLGERLGREHEQRGVRLVAHDGVDDRELVAERLPGRGAGGDDDVATVVERVDRRRLVRPEPVDAPGLEPLDDLGVKRVGELGHAGLACRERSPVDQPARELGIGCDLRERVAGIHAVDVTT